MWFIKHHVIKAYRGVEIYLHAILTSALDETERSVSCSIALSVVKNLLYSMRPQTGLEFGTKRKTLPLMGVESELPKAYSAYDYASRPGPERPT